MSFGKNMNEQQDRHTSHRSHDFLLFSSLIPLYSFSSYSVSGGQCWSTTDSPSSGRCNSLLQTETSREECCSGAGASFAAYNDQDLTSGELFFLRAFRGGVPCQPCISKSGMIHDSSKEVSRRTQCSQR